MGKSTYSVYPCNASIITRPTTPIGCSSAVRL